MTPTGGSTLTQIQVRENGPYLVTGGKESSSLILWDRAFWTLR